MTFDFITSIKKKFTGKIELLENKVNIDLKYFIKNSPSLFLLTIVGIVNGLILSIIFTRTVSQELYGIYVYIFTIFATLTFFTVNGMNISVQRSSSRNKDGVLTKSTKIRLKWSVLGSLSIIGLSVFYYSTTSNIILAQCLFLSALFFPFYYCLDVAQDFLSGKMLFNKYSFFKIILSITTTLGTIVVLIITKNILWALLINLIINAIIQIYIWTYTVKNEKTNNEPDEESMEYGKKMTLIGLIPLVTGQLDTIVVANVLGFAQVAIFNIANAAVSFSSTPRAIVQSLIFPKIVVMDRKMGAQILFEKVKYIVILSIATCIILALLFPILIPLFYTENYSDSIFIAQILLLSEVVASPGGVFTQMLKAQGRSGDLFRLTMITRLISTALLFVLIPLLGLMGAVLVRIIYNLSSTLYSIYIAKTS